VKRVGAEPVASGIVIVAQHCSIKGQILVVCGLPENGKCLLLQCPSS